MIIILICEIIYFIKEGTLCENFLNVFLLGLIFLFTISLNKCVKANSINSISMDIYIDKNGDANITETWNCYSDSGTEVYHPYYNLGNSQIINLSVKEGSDYYSTILIGILVQIFQIKLINVVLIILIMELNYVGELVIMVLILIQSIILLQILFLLCLMLKWFIGL